MIRALFLFCATLTACAADNSFVNPTGENLWFSTNTPGIVGYSRKQDGKFTPLKLALIDPLPASEDFKLESILTGHVEELKTARYPLKLDSTKPIHLEIFANRLGSSLDPVLRIVDSQSNEVAYVEDEPFAGRDVRLTFAPKTPGAYAIEIRDVAHGSGFFALKAATKIPPPPEPTQDEDRELQLPTTLTASFNTPGDRDTFQFTVAKDDRWIFTATTRELGSPCDAHLIIRDDKGSVLAESIGVGPNGPSITNTFKTSGPYKLEVCELSKLAGPGYNYRLDIQKFRAGALVSAETFSDKIKFTAQRFNYDGPITVTAPGLDPITIPEKKKEAERVSTVTELKIVQFTAEAAGHRNLVSTAPDVRKAFPLMMFPPPALEGWIIVPPAAIK